MRESTACPGCGLELPPNRWAVPPRSYASSECVELSGEVVGFESEHFELVRDYHQLFVDAYLAQHAPPVSADQPISVPYSLVGLHLALDRDVAGTTVRDIHQCMGRATCVWEPWSDQHPAVTTLTDEILRRSERRGPSGVARNGHCC